MLKLNKIKLLLNDIRIFLYINKRKLVRKLSLLLSLWFSHIILGSYNKIIKMISGIRVLVVLF